MSRSLISRRSTRHFMVPFTLMAVTVLGLSGALHAEELLEEPLTEMALADPILDAAEMAADEITDSAVELGYELALRQHLGADGGTIDVEVDDDFVVLGGVVDDPSTSVFAPLVVEHVSEGSVQIANTTRVHPAAADHGLVQVLTWTLREERMERRVDRELRSVLGSDADALSVVVSGDDALVMGTLDTEAELAMVERELQMVEGLSRVTTLVDLAS